jgi:hypothetical protein
MVQWVSPQTFGRQQPGVAEPAVDARTSNQPERPRRPSRSLDSFGGNWRLETPSRIEGAMSNGLTMRIVAMVGICGHLCRGVRGGTACGEPANAPDRARREPQAPSATAGDHVRKSSS